MIPHFYAVERHDILPPAVMLYHEVVSDQLSVISFWSSVIERFPYQELQTNNQ
jgi:hypothetical protein